jgi:RNA polymerase sigma-B factor
MSAPAPSAPMTFDVTAAPDGPRAVRLTAHGELDSDGAGTLADRLTSALTRYRCERVLVDFTDVPFIDAAGVRALLLGHRQAGACQAELRLVGAHGLVRQVLEITGALDVLTTAPAVAARPR